MGFVAGACVLLAAVEAAAGLKVGMVGDTGFGSGARKTYDIMKSQGVDVVLQNGDFDYVNSVSGWGSFLDKNFLGGKPGREVLMTQGNHDLSKWTGYQAMLHGKMSSGLRSRCKGRPGKPLETEYGNYMSCNMGNVHVVMLGWNQLEEQHIDEGAEFIDAAFVGTAAKWRVCMWHRPEGLYNPGLRHTSNYGMWALYKACRNHGAMVVSGHSHLYARSKLMDDFETMKVSPVSDKRNVRLGCGRSVSIVSGMGGFLSDPPGKHSVKNHFESMYHLFSGWKINGALVCDFPDTGSAPAKCDFLIGSAPGVVRDTFRLTSDCVQGTPLVLPPKNPATQPVPNQVVELEARIAEGGDDVEEVSRWWMRSSSSDLDFFCSRVGRRATIGIRWASVHIPKGATVVSAHIEFTAGESGATAGAMNIGLDSDSDSDEFGMRSRPSERKLASRRVVWDLAPWTKGERYETPDFAATLQQVVAQPDWTSGNAVSAIIVNNDNSKCGPNRKAMSKEANGVGPVLKLAYRI